MTSDLEKLAANLASLNEIVTELVRASADGMRADPEFAVLVRDTLREHSRALGYVFQGERGTGYLELARKRARENRRKA